MGTTQQPQKNARRRAAKKKAKLTGLDAWREQVKKNPGLAAEVNARRAATLRARAAEKRAAAAGANGATAAPHPPAPDASGSRPRRELNFGAVASEIQRLTNALAKAERERDALKIALRLMQTED